MCKTYLYILCIQVLLRSTYEHVLHGPNSVVQDLHDTPCELAGLTDGCRWVVKMKEWRGRLGAVLNIFRHTCPSP